MPRFLCTLTAAAVLGVALTAQAAEGTGAKDTPATSPRDDAAKNAAADGPEERTNEDKPIELAYIEGDVAGLSSILSEDGKSVIGMIEYRQHRHGDVLEISRFARFTDGSSDEDHVKAHVGKTLRTIGGRMVIRDTKGNATVDLKIDIASGRITGSSGLGKERKTYNEEADLSPATYWGPLIGVLLKNFDRNAVDGTLEFRTVVATPKPRAIGMELTRKEATSTRRPGATTKATRYSLSVSINPLLDPLIRLVTPKTDFFMQAGDPPAMTRFAGPRNYEGRKIRIE